MKERGYLRLRQPRSFPHFSLFFESSLDFFEPGILFGKNGNLFFLIRQFHEILLCIHRRPIISDMAVSAVQMQFACFCVVGKIDVHQRKDFFLDGFVQNRKFYFDPFDHVTGHHVCGRQEKILIAVMMEIVDTAMLQETTDNAADMDIITDARNLGLQAADAADDQIHPYACLTGFV